MLGPAGEAGTDGRALRFPAHHLSNAGNSGGNPGLTRSGMGDDRIVVPLSPNRLGKEIREVDPEPEHPVESRTRLASRRQALTADRRVRVRCPKFKEQDMSSQGPRRRRARRSVTALAALATATTTVFAVAAPIASATPVDVQVRVEGRNATIYDRTIRTDVRTVKALSDPTERTCDGTNNGMNPTSTPTATSATVDAMASIGQPFDAQWYDGFDDYFLKQWGPEREGEDYWWGILVNDAFTPVGGCQFAVVTGDRILWVNDAFNGRPFLWLAAPATATVGQPLTVDVRTSTPGEGGDTPTRTPYEGATVGGVTIAAQPTVAGVVDAGTSDEGGTATVTFHQTGWQRIKARTVAPDADSSPPAIPSNSVDVCVTPVGGGTCSGPPPGLTPDVAPDPDPDPDPTETTPTTPSTPTVPTTPTTPTVPVTTPVRIAPPSISTAGGTVRVAWTVLDAGVGVRDWTLEARPLTPAGGKFTVAARGTTATSAVAALTAGRSYVLKLTVTDTLGRASSGEVGRVFVPTDDRAKALRYGRGWKKVADQGAWKATVTRGGKGASASVRLPAGKPMLVLRGGSAAARVEVTVGGRRETFVVSSSRRPVTRTITARKRAAAGTVKVRVIRGTVSLDGIGIAP